jgi:two-component system sensor histidine kinase DegS
VAEVSVKRINEIIKSTLKVIEESRGAIFEIAENARKEVAILKDEVKALHEAVRAVISEGEKLEKLLLKSRIRLAEINRDFTRYNEEDMKSAYEEADTLRIELAVVRERESQLIIRRNDVERRLKNAIETVGRAEKLVAQVGTVLDYLQGDLSKLDEHIIDAENKRVLALRIIKTQEDERRRIAREMHDGPAQAMSNVVLKAELCERLAEVDMDKARAELSGLKEVARDCLKEVRRIIYDLRPMSIDDLGLKPTLQKYLEGFRKDTGLHIDLMIRGEDRRIKDSNIALAIFRIVQECLNNIERHARATQVVVQLEFMQKYITVRVKDDGKGFDTSVISEENRDDRGGFGILGMRERVELLEGSFHIESSAGAGTSIRVRLPYNA